MEPAPVVDVRVLVSVLVVLVERAGWLAHATPMPGRALLGGSGARSSAAARLPLLVLPARPPRSPAALRVVAVLRLGVAPCSTGRTQTASAAEDHDLRLEY